MKWVPILVCLFSWVGSAAAQQGELPHCKISVKVVGEESEPLSEAKVTFAFLKPNEDSEAPVIGLTGSDGLITREGPCLSTMSGNVQKSGYYSSGFETKQFEKALEGKWQPWNPTVQVVLRKIVKPIPMFAKRVDTDVPDTDKPIGFDLAEGDWIAPYGRGKTSDMVFTLNRRFTDDRDYESTLTVAFSSDGNGIQICDSSQGYHSALKLPRIAPDGGYMQRLVLSNKRMAGAFVERDVREDRNYFFRVRAVVDQRGGVVGGQYGKIDGDIRFSPIRSKTCSLMFTYYLNPTPNDRNLEFDPKRNLFTNLKNEERVTAPKTCGQ
jgi:hypothetical protein